VSKTKVLHYHFLYDKGEDNVKWVTDWTHSF